jgi:POT family proton-dependent oligopeptide transporter
MHGAEGGQVNNLEEKLDEEISVTATHEGISKTHN